MTTRRLEEVEMHSHSEEEEFPGQSKLRRQFVTRMDRLCFSASPSIFIDLEGAIGNPWAIM